MNSFLIHTRGDALGAMRTLLKMIWEKMRLDGMLVPVISSPGGTPQPVLITNIDDLQLSDPFAPMMAVNSSRLLDSLQRSHPGGHLAAVLRPCELRALDCSCSYADWLVIGMDCLGSYRSDDYLWRSRSAGSLDLLTRTVLRNSRQGGISDEALRPACQVCGSPIPRRADLSIHTLGLPVRDVLVVESNRPGLAVSLGLVEPAGYEWERMHDFVLRKVSERRRQVLEREIAGLTEAHHLQPAALIARLQFCAPCTLCLDVCPEYDGSWKPGMDTNYTAVETWLSRCTGCGMCEQACPESMPLTVMHADLKRQARGAPGRC